RRRPRPCCSSSAASRGSGRSSAASTHGARADTRWRRSSPPPPSPWPYPRLRDFPMNAGSRKRCEWSGSDPAMPAYHDREWGRPVHDDRVLFEFLALEGAQAGLSWSTILRKRDSYRRAFAKFDPAAVARYGKRQVRELMADPGIVRNRLKIESAISNAKAVLRVQEELGSFDRYLWQFVGGRPLRRK